MPDLPAGEGLHPVGEPTQQPVVPDPGLSRRARSPGVAALVGDCVVDVGAVRTGAGVRGVGVLSCASLPSVPNRGVGRNGKEAQLNICPTGSRTGVMVNRW